jgi:hypothetical protein
VFAWASSWSGKLIAPADGRSWAAGKRARAPKGLPPCEFETARQAIVGNVETGELAPRLLPLAGQEIGARQFEPDSGDPGMLGEDRTEDPDRIGCIAGRERLQPPQEVRLDDLGRGVGRRPGCGLPRNRGGQDGEQDQAGCKLAAGPPH